MTDVDPRVGQVFSSRFRIEELIGRGGMASVYRADDVNLRRRVALKIFDSGEAGDDSRREAEVHALARLNHPNLVSLFDAHLASADDPEPSFLVMELVDGPSLNHAIDAGTVDGPATALIAAEIGEALNSAHSLGIVHRDLKPGNILLAPTELPSEPFRAKLADFGIAHLVGSSRLTVTGTVMGTAAYLSPEQITGSDPGTPSDLYSLGLVLLECLTGRTPFPGTMAESMSARLARDPEIPADLPPAWQQLLVELTSRDPAIRPSALELATRSRLLAGELVGWSSGASDAGSDAATVAMPAPTLLLVPPIAADAATRVLEADAATQVLGSATPEAATQVLGNSAQPSARPPARRPRRLVIVAAAVAVLLAGGIALAAALGGTGPGVTTTPTPGVTSGATSGPSPSASVVSTPIAPSVPAVPVAPGNGKGNGKGGGHNKP